MTISVVAIDDDPDDLAILRHHLDRMPGIKAEVRAFIDPQEGLAACLERRPDVLLLDYVMGAVTGLDVFEEICAANVGVPVVLVTDQGSEEIAVNALHSGVSDYMPKEVASPQSLRRSILNSIERAHLHRAVREHREQLEETIRVLQKRSEEIQGFYHSLSHELKTPLTAAREFLSIVLDGIQGPVNAEQRESLSTALAACDQITANINDIIDVSRIETGKLTLEIALQPIAPIVRQAVAQCSARADKKRITVACSVDDEELEAPVDRHRLFQVLANLIDNALKFTPEGGAVSVQTTAASDDEATFAIRVTDDGCGIAVEDQPRIFDRLYQSKRVDAAAQPGMGLGLHLCRELVQSHGGRIEVDSEQGRGSEFTCWLPAGPIETQTRMAS